MSSESSSTAFLSAVVNRRSIYSLSKESTISDGRLQDILKTTLDNTPSTFASYTTRIVLLVHGEHDKFWDMTAETFKAIAPEESWAFHKSRIDGFKAGYGTILFYEDPENIELLKTKYAIVADKMPEWSAHTSAMHQFIVWTALEAEGLGASLQHFNPHIDVKTSSEWGIPVEWSLVAQMPFGKPIAPPRPRNTMMKKPMEERLKVFGVAT